MNSEISTFLSEARKQMIDGKLQQAFDYCIQAGSSLIADPDLSDPDFVLKVGLQFGELGHQCYYKENYQLALNAYWIALMFIPEDYTDDRVDSGKYMERPSILFMIGKCYIELKKWEEAILALKRAKEDRLPWGEEGYLFSTLAELYFSLERYEEGIEEYKALLKYEKETRFLGETYVVDAYDRIVHVYQKQGKHTEALEYLEEVFENSFELDLSAEDTAEQYLNYAESIGSKEYEEALQDVIGFEPQDSHGIDYVFSDEEPYKYCLDAFARLGKLYLNEKKYTEAEKYLNAVYKWKKTDPSIIRTLARLHIKQGDIPRAEKLLEKAKSIAPEESANWDLMAELFLKKEEFVEALDAAEKGMKVVEEKKSQNPEDAKNFNDLLAGLYLRKIDALIKLDQNENALVQLETARKLFPKTELFYSYSAVLLYLSNRPDEAKEVIDAAANQEIPISERMREIKNRVASIIE